MQSYVLVLYYSKYGSTKEMAHLIANGVESAGMAVKIRTVPNLSTVVKQAKPSISRGRDIYCTLDDLANVLRSGFGFTDTLWQYGLRDEVFLGSDHQSLAEWGFTSKTGLCLYFIGFDAWRTGKYITD